MATLKSWGLTDDWESWDDEKLNKWIDGLTEDQQEVFYGWLFEGEDEAAPQTQRVQVESVDISTFKALGLTDDWESWDDEKFDKWIGGLTEE